MAIKKTSLLCLDDRQGKPYMLWAAGRPDSSKNLGASVI